MSSAAEQYRHLSASSNCYPGQPKHLDSIHAMVPLQDCAHCHCSIESKKSTSRSWRRCTFTLSFTLITLTIFMLVVLLLIKIKTNVFNPIESERNSRNEKKELIPFIPVFQSPNSSKYTSDTMHHWATYKLNTTAFQDCKPSLQNRPCLNKHKQVVYTSSRGVIAPWQCSQENQNQNIESKNYEQCREESLFLWSRNMKEFTVKEEGLYLILSQMRFHTKSSSLMTVILTSEQHKDGKLVHSESWRSCTVDNRSRSFWQRSMKQWNKAEDMSCLLHGIKWLRPFEHWMKFQTADFSVPLYSTETFFQIFKI